MTLLTTLFASWFSAPHTELPIVMQEKKSLISTAEVIAALQRHDPSITGTTQDTWNVLAKALLTLLLALIISKGLKYRRNLQVRFIVSSRPFNSHFEFTLIFSRLLVIF